MMRYEITRVDKLIGGHYAAHDIVEDKLIGDTWRLDRERAVELVRALNKASEGSALRGEARPVSAQLNAQTRGDRT
jgi:hypothetical protein